MVVATRTGTGGSVEPTQLESIRDFLIAAAHGGVWLTLAEIAEATVVGEASVSAQIRNLRKPEFGSYTIHKRRRGSNGHGVVWEYRLQV
jgi:hypothetical protein